MKFIEKFIQSVLNFHKFKEPLLLLIIVAVAGGIWVFMALAEQVQDHETHSFDRKILLAMRSPQNSSDPLGPFWFEEAVRDVTSLGGMPILFLVTGAVVCYLWLQRKGGMALVMFIAVMGGLILSTVLKEIFGRPRPDVITHLYKALHFSFPSGHSMMAAVTYLTLGALLAKSEPKRSIKIFFISIAIILTIMVGVSRVYIGVHWPSDVLAGWAAGAAWALLCWLLAHWLQLLGKIEKADGSESKGTSHL